MDRVFLFNTVYIFFQERGCIILNLCLLIAIINNNLLLLLPIGLVDRVFANGPGDWGPIQGQVIPKTLKMVLDTSLLNTQHYKVYIKGKVEQSRERSSALPYTLV